MVGYLKYQSALQVVTDQESRGNDCLKAQKYDRFIGITSQDRNSVRGGTHILRQIYLRLQKRKMGLMGLQS